MIISSLGLETLALNCTLSPYVRKKIGEALKTAIYDPEKTHFEKYALLKEPQSYECPDQEMLLLCSEYLENNVSGLLLEVKF